MRVTVGAQALIENPTPEVLAKCNSLQITNPAYVSSLRFGSIYAAAKIPKTLPGCVIDPATDAIQVPRSWFFKELNLPAKHVYSDADAEYPVPQLTLFDYQEQAADAYFKEVNANDKLGLPTDATIVLPTSGGKTVLGMFIAYYTGAKALVIVPTQEIEAAWIEDCCRIFQCDPKEIGCIRGKKVRIGKFFTVGSVQTLMRLDPSLWADKFGLIIADEVHRLPGASFINVLRAGNAELRLGLTATDIRKDGMMPAVRWHLGKNCYYDISPRNSVPLVYTGVISDYSCPPTSLDNGQPVYEWQDVLGKLTTSKIRLAGTVSLVRYIRENYGGHILISSARVDHINMLYEALNKEFLNKVPIAILIGQSGGSRKELYADIKQGKYPITIATQSIVSEGASNPKWWHLIQTTPVSDPKTVMQLKGRPIRIDSNDSSKEFGYFWDIIDNIQMCRNMARTRYSAIKAHTTKIQWMTLTHDHKNKTYTVKTKD